MEVENGYHFKFYCENKDRLGRFLPNNLSNKEIEEYNTLCSENYNWHNFVEENKTKKIIGPLFKYAETNNLLTNDINETDLIYFLEATTPDWFYEKKFIENTSDIVLDKIKKNKLIVVFNFFSEPHYDDKFNETIENVCIENGFNTENFFVLTSGNNLEKNTKLEHISDHFFISNATKVLTQFLKYKIVKPNTFDYVCEIVNHDIFNKKKSKHFLCLNRHVDRPHRYAFGLFVEKYNLWDKGNFTFLVCPEEKDDDALIEAFNLQTAKEFSIFKKQFHNKIPVQIDTKYLLNNIQFSHFGTTSIYYKPIYEETAINIVTETTFRKNSVFLSEKTFHPIINLQPFIMFASNGQLAELRKLGFKTFGNMIDESYDDESDNHKRFKMVCDEILRLSNMSIDDINELFFACKDICIHNRNHLLSFKDYDVFTNSFIKIKNIWNSNKKELL